MKIGETIIASLTAVIAAALPAPWNMIAGMFALIAVILMNAGLNPVCETKTKEPLH